MGASTAVAMGASMLGGVADMYGQQQSAKAQQKSLKANEEYARQQAQETVEQADAIAVSQEEKGIEDSKRSRLADKRKLEKQRAMSAESGVALDYGSPLHVFETDDITSQLNTNDIFDAGLNAGAETRYAGSQKERGLLWDAEQYKYQRKLSKSTAKTNMWTGLLKTGTSMAGAGMGTTGSGTTGVKK